MYFQEEFHKWRVNCATATTLAAEDLTYPPSDTKFPLDMREHIKKAEKAAALLEKQVYEHLQSTYHVWEQLPLLHGTAPTDVYPPTGVGRRQKELEKLKEVQYATKQENANLKMQIEHLNRLQQPREFRIVPPAKIPIEETYMNYLLGLGASGVNGTGVTVEERHVDLNTMVSRAIDRWKSVILSTKSGAGLGAQKSLDQVTPSTTPTNATPVSLPPSQQRVSGSHSQAPPPRSLALPPALPTGTSAPTTAPSAVDGDDSDEDADADMDEGDGFAPIPPPVITKVPAPVQHPLEVPRTRAHNQRGAGGTETRFAINGNNSINRGLSVRHSIPNANATSQMAGQRQPQQAHINNDEYINSTNQGVVCGDPMYSE